MLVDCDVLAAVGAERKPATIALLERLIAESQKKKK